MKIASLEIFENIDYFLRVSVMDNLNEVKYKLFAASRVNKQTLSDPPNQPIPQFYREMDYDFCI